MSLLDKLLNRKPHLDQPRSDTGRAHYGGFLDEDELNLELRGRSGLRIYNKMFRGDHDVRRNVSMVVNPLVGATWATEPFGGKEATEQDQQVADDVAWCLGLGPYANTTPNLTPWAYHLAEFLPVLVRSGFCPGEVVWTRGKRDGRDLLTVQQIGLRLPSSIHRWITDPADAALQGGTLTGAGAAPARGLLAIEQYQAGRGGFVILPRQDLVYYRVGMEGDNWEGISMLRPVYKAWLIKDKIERLDAMGIEREAVGLPVLYPPKGGATTPAMLSDMESKLGQLRAGNLAYLIMPGPSAEHDPETGWGFEIAGLAGSGGGGKRDAQPTLQYWRDAIAAAFIVEFMRLGQGGEGAKGAMATAEVQDDPFSQALSAMAAPIIAETLRIIVRRFVTLNYGEDTPVPQITMNLNEADVTGLAAYVAPLVTAGLLHPDDPLEDFLRERGELPPADPAAREERKTQEAEAHQAEVDAVKAGAAVQPPSGADSHKEAVTKTTKPDGTRSEKREVTKTKARTLELQVITPMLGEHPRCPECAHRHDPRRTCPPDED